MAIHKAWLDAEGQGDIESMLSLCSNNIRLCPPDRSVKQGRLAVREYLQTSPDSIQDIEISNIHIEISGSLAYKTADFVTKLDELQQSKPRTIQGSHLWVLRREDTGWRIIIIVWSAW